MARIIDFHIPRGYEPPARRTSESIRGEVMDFLSVSGKSSVELALASTSRLGILPAEESL